MNSWLRKNWLRCSLAALVGGGLVLVWWLNAAAPPYIPYDRWDISTDRTFPMSESEPDPNPNLLRNDDLLHAEDFVFTMGVGSGMFGLHVFRVDATGHGFFVFFTGPDVWWKAELKVSAATVTKLRRLLVDVDFKALQRAYHGAAVDGTQWCLRVDVAGHVKKVYCNNYFPTPVQKLASLIGRDILPAHEKEITRAKRIGQPTAEQAADGLW